MDEETNNELLSRYQTVKELLASATKRAKRCVLGSVARSHRMRWAGSLQFTVLQLESQLRDRGLFERENLK